MNQDAKKKKALYALQDKTEDEETSPSPGEGRQVPEEEMNSAAQGVTPLAASPG